MNITEQFDGLPTRSPHTIVYPSLKEVETNKELLAEFFNETPDAWTQFFAWREQYNASRPMNPLVIQHDIQ